MELSDLSTNPVISSGSEITNTNAAWWTKKKIMIPIGVVLVTLCITIPLIVVYGSGNKGNFTLISSPSTF